MQGVSYPRCSQMKERIFQIMKQEGLNQKEFAATTGISPATLSSIFNGRTSPTLNHAEALHRRFPRLNMSWLMFGEGDMYVTQKNDSGQSGDVASGSSSGSYSGKDVADGFDGDDMGQSSALPFNLDGTNPRIPTVREVVKYIDKPQRRITSITIFFDDGSFETFPGKPIVNTK